MYKQFFTALDSTALPMAAMVFFIVAFVLVLIRTFRLKKKADYESIAGLPLQDDGDSFDQNLQDTSQEEVKP